MTGHPSQTSGRNPWTKEQLLQYLEQAETPYLEFKSSQPLCIDQERRRYLDDLAAHAGAFLNAEGGLLLIGLEEGRRPNAPDVATKLSPGVPRAQLSAARLENMLCDRIHPSVAGLIRVHNIPIGVASEGEILAFAVEIKPGITAYQAPDLKYYVRRGYSSEPMEDKDIRLRMLSPQSARVSLAATLDLKALDLLILEHAISPGQTVGLGVSIRVANIGVRTVRRFCIDVKLSPVTPCTRDPSAATLHGWTAREPRFDWSSEDAAVRPLFPDDVVEFLVAKVDVSGSWNKSEVMLMGRFACFLDDAPSTLLEVDFSDQYREAVDLIARRYQERTAR